MSDVTHADLVERGAWWLLRLRRLPSYIVITEMANGGGEEPDVIGFGTKWSVLLECKASRQDFLTDAKKFYRRHPEHGMGTHRLFLCPEGLIQPEELPPAWGLLYATTRGIREVVRSFAQERDMRREQAVLVSACRRLGVRATEGISVRVYTHQTKCRATLGVVPEAEEAGG